MSIGVRQEVGELTIMSRLPNVAQRGEVYERGRQ